MITSRRSKQRAGRGVAQLVDLLVDVRVLLDIGSCLGDIGFGLVVVVVGDEVFDGVVGEELLELLVELGGQRLVMGQHQGRALGALDDLRHDEGLARAVAPSRVCVRSRLYTLHQFLDRFRLVAHRYEI